MVKKPRISVRPTMVGLEQNYERNLVIVGMVTWKKRCQEPENEHLNLFHRLPKIVSGLFGLMTVLVRIDLFLVLKMLVLIQIVDIIILTCT